MHKKQTVEKDTAVFPLFFLCTNFVNFGDEFYVIIGKLEIIFMTFSFLSDNFIGDGDYFVLYINTWFVK